MNNDTLLFVTNSLESNERWSAVFDEVNIDVLTVSELNVTLNGTQYGDADIILVEARGAVEHDVDLCTRLKTDYDIPLLILADNVTEEFALATYDAGVDECISGNISAALLRAKISAWIRWQKRQPLQMYQLHMSRQQQTQPETREY